MASLLIKNIGLLAGIHEGLHALRGHALSSMTTIDDAFMLIEDGQIASFGAMNNLSKSLPDNALDARGGIVLPAWCDSHTHLVHAGAREQEFVAKIKGQTYAEIAAGGGGILQSAKKLSSAPEEQLYRDAYSRVQEAMRLGTGSLEIKSGYGLTLDAELKMLRVIKKLKQTCPITIRSTFLGAHTYPAAYHDSHEDYIRIIIEEMLPAIAQENLADHIDVFCEQGFFSNEETRRVCTAGQRYGLKPKIHANQLSSTGAVEAAIAIGALSVDHLETMDEHAINSLADSDTIGTLLPTAAFFLRMSYPPARTLVDHNAAIALASDYNPGSSPGFNMNFVVSLACIGMRMLPEEAINAATFNGACAMDIQQFTGSIASGKRADLIITKPIPSLAYLPYSFSSNVIATVLINGEPLH